MQTVSKIKLLEFLVTRNVGSKARGTLRYRGVIRKYKEFAVLNLNVPGTAAI